MKRSALESRTSLALLATAGLAFATGLVVLTRLHMGHGALRVEVLGLSRLAWLALHRLSSLAALAALGLHLALHWRALVGRVRSSFRPTRPGDTVIELILYAAFAITAAAGVAAWLGEGAPLLGPSAPGPLEHARHRLVDLHHLTGLLALALSAHHLFHRWGRLFRGLGGRGRPVADPPKV